MNYSDALPAAIAAAREAGELLRDEFHRPGGPRGSHGKAPVDREAGRRIRERLLASFPDYGWCAEEEFREAHHPAQGSQGHLWLVGPNDGTSAFQNGVRGSAIAIALLRDGRPVLGVVYAFVAPDSAGDLLAWAEGCGPLTRNGAAVERRPFATALGSDTVVFLPHSDDRRAEESLRCVSPGRFSTLPSAAYRLALVAAGDGEVAITTNGADGWNYAAGHALLHGVGGSFVDQAGHPITYSPHGRSDARSCFGGAPDLVAEIRGRGWGRRFFAPGRAPAWSDSPRNGPRVPGCLKPGPAMADPFRLQRAQGCLLGQLAGDALGSLVEFGSVLAIRQRYPAGVRELRDGGTWNTIAGQPTDDSELALSLARSILRQGSYDVEEAAQAYAGWCRSNPFDIGHATMSALGSVNPADCVHRRAAAAARAGADPTTQANGSLMRISPLGIWGHRLPLDQLADDARADSQLTHPHPICQEACAVFSVAIALAIAQGLGAVDLYHETIAWAERSCNEPGVLADLRAAEHEPPADFQTHQGWVRIAFQNAFYQLLHAPSPEEGIAETVMAGGDTDTTAAIAGALLGAVGGREAIPSRWRRAILTCRPLWGFEGIHQPRPRAFWPVDALTLAECLLLAGE